MIEMELPIVFSDGSVPIYKKPIVCPSERVIYMPVGKAASTSVRRSLKPQTPWKYITKDWLALTYAGWKTVAVVRDPMERAQNTYRFFKRKFDLDCHLPTTSWEGFVDALYHSPDDITDCHVRSQVALLSHQNELLPTHLIPFEELDRVKEHLPIPTLLHAEHTRADKAIEAPLTPEIRRKLEKRFRADLRLLDSL